VSLSNCALFSCPNSGAPFSPLCNNTKSVEYRLLIRIGKRQEAKGGIDNQSLITGFSITNSAARNPLGCYHTLCFLSKKLFFAIKLHKKRSSLCGEIDSFTRLNEDYPVDVARVSTVPAQKSTE
jgi:hypothetical protein